MTPRDVPCGACQAPIPAGGRFCPECGAASAPAPTHGARWMPWIVGAAVVALLVLGLLWMGGDSAAPAASNEPALVDVVVTDAVDPDTWAPTGAQDAFAPDTPVLYAVVTADVPEGGGALDVVWFHGDTPIGETTLAFEGGPAERQVAYIEGGETTPWATGAYRAVVHHGDEALRTVHFNVTSGLGTARTDAADRATSTEWDVAYDAATGFWTYRVLVTNAEPHALEGITLAAWTNLSDAAGVGHAQRHENLTVAAGSRTLFVLDVLHPSNDPGRNVAATLHVTGGVPLAPVHETRHVHHNAYGGGTYGSEGILSPPDADVQRLDGHGAHVKWRVAYDESREAWRFTVRLYNLDAVALENVAVNASIAGDDRTFSASDAVTVEAETVREVTLEVADPSRLGSSVSAILVVDAPAPLGLVEETRPVTYNAYGGGTYGGDGP